MINLAMSERLKIKLQVGTCTRSHETVTEKLRMRKPDVSFRA